MKTARLVLVFVMVLMALSATAQQAVPPANAPAEVVTSLNSFGLRLHRALAARNPQANLVHPPCSVGTSLAALSCGADGETLAELRKVLGLPDEARLLTGHEGFNHSLAQSLRQSQAVSLRVANRLYLQKGWKAETRFRKTLEDVFHHDIEMADFEGSRAGERRAINTWIEQRSGGAFREFLPEGMPSSDSTLLLVNTVVFRSPWRDFATKDTHTGIFNLPGKRTASVPMMKTESGTLRAEKRANHSAVSLEFPGSHFSFLILVPATDVPLETLEASLTPEALAAYPQMPQRTATLYLPRFHLHQAATTLPDILKTLGMARAFSPGEADFGRLSPKGDTKPLFLKDMVYQARVKVDEGGVYAAATSSLGLAPFGSAPETDLIIRADKPFLFAIQHSKSGACLFLGRVTDPR